MHKYQPRIHIIKKKESPGGKELENDLEQDTSNAESKTFVFHETEFITVTAYQNQQVRGNPTPTLPTFMLDNFLSFKKGSL